MPTFCACSRRRWLACYLALLSPLCGCSGGPGLARASLDLPRSDEMPFGQLLVRTKRIRYRDGGIDYYPHSPYEVLDRDGRRVRRVENHVGMNDENPATVTLPVGIYVIRPLYGTKREITISVRRGSLVEVDCRTVDSS